MANVKPSFQTKPRTRRWRWLIGGIACLAALIDWFRFGVYPPNHFEYTSQQQPPQEIPVTPVPVSPFLNTAEEVAYVGSRRCFECHQAEHETYQQTGHSRALAKVDSDNEPPDGLVDHLPSARRYRISRADGKLWHQEWHVRPNGDTVELASNAVGYAIGSGRFARSYLIQWYGFLFESPVTWYATKNAWDMSPGYDRAQHQSFHRAVSQECIHCHSGQITSVQGSQYRFAFRELAIGCERCHGPGSLHLERHARGGDEYDGIDRTIVNPHHLPRDLAEAVCQDCHLNADAVAPARGCSPQDFRPGLPLYAFRHNDIRFCAAHAWLGFLPKVRLRTVADGGLPFCYLSETNTLIAIID